MKMPRPPSHLVLLVLAAVLGLPWATPIAALFAQEAAATARPSLGGASGTEPDLLPLPDIDLDRLEPLLAEQIRQLSAIVRSLESGGPQEGARRAAAYGNLGHLYVYYEIPDAAEVCYENARRLAPTDPRWSYYLGFLYADLGRPEEAAAAFQQVLRLSPDDLPTLVRSGNLELERGRFDDASPYFTHALEIDPDLAAAWYGQGRVAQARGETGEAIRDFEKTLELQPEATLVFYSLGQAYRSAGDVERAKESLAKYGQGRVHFDDPLVETLKDATSISSLELVHALAADRTRFPDLQFLSYTLAFLTNMEGSAGYLERQLQAWPADARAEDRLTRARLHYAVGGLLIQEQQEERAAGHLRRAIELEPSILDARVKLANIEARAGRIDDAREQLDAVLAADPDNDGARLKRAAAAMADGEWSAAVADLLLLERRLPDSFEVLNRLAVSLEAVDRWQEAVPRYLAAARLDPSDERAARNGFAAARLLAAEDRSEEAQRTLEDALARDPKLLDARLLLAGLLIRADRPAEALSQFDEALARDPQAVDAHVGRATVLLLMGRYRTAASVLDASLVTVPDNAAITLLLSRVLAAAPDPAARDPRRATTLARRLEETNPTARTAETLAMAAATEGRFDDAVAWQRKAVERARRSGQESLAAYFEARIQLYAQQRTWQPAGPDELIVLPNEL